MARSDDGIPTVMDDWDEEFKRRTGRYPFTGSWSITMLDGRTEQGSTGVYFGINVTHESLDGIVIQNPTIINARIP